MARELKFQFWIFALLIVCAAPAIASICSGLVKAPEPIAWLDGEITVRRADPAAFDRMLQGALGESLYRRLKEFAFENSYPQVTAHGATLVREGYVAGATRSEVEAELLGPVTGPLGFGPRFKSLTPVSEQVWGDKLSARSVTVEGLPYFIGSQARGTRIAPGVVTLTVQGRAVQAFTVLVVLPETTIHGRRAVPVVEMLYTVAEATAQSVWELPGAFISKMIEDTVGLPVKIASSLALARAHAAVFDAASAVTQRINSRRRSLSRER